MKIYKGDGYILGVPFSYEFEEFDYVDSLGLLKISYSAIPSDFDYFISTRELFRAVCKYLQV